MIEYASKYYPNLKLKFEVGNIVDDTIKLQKSIKLNCGLDMIASVHCLHWSKNKRKALAYIYEMRNSCQLNKFFPVIL